MNGGRTGRKPFRGWILLLVFLGGVWAGCLAPRAVTYEDEAREILAGMTLDQKAAQLICAAPPVLGSVSFQKKYQFGGYILFEKNIAGQTKASLGKRIRDWQAASGIPMLIGVDEEGGSVVRISKYRTFRAAPFLSPRRAYQAGGWTRILSDAREKDALLHSLGINANFAPVVDVPYHTWDFMYSRAFSTRAQAVSRYAEKVVRQANQDYMVPVMKHFPGYGSNVDTHTGIARDTRSRASLEKRDLLPFAAGIRAGCPMIMVSHNIINCFDRRYPASVSKAVHRYLRNTMGFDGVIITDAMDMAGITRIMGGGREAVVRAILAGNDMVCTKDGKTAFLGLREAVRSGRISRTALDGHVLRILRMKLRYGMMESRAAR